MKSLIDGTVAALQAQRDPTSAELTAPIVARQLGQDSAHIRRLLLDPGRAVLGVRDRH